MDSSNLGLTGKGTLWRSLATGIMADMADLMYQVRWLFLLAILLVLIDFWFGIRVSKAQNIPIRRSRAGRRTLNKAIDYLCYITLGIVLGKAFGEPFGQEPHTLAVIIMLLCCGFEIDSIWSHICVLHGIRKPLSVWRVIIRILSFNFKGVKEELSDIGTKIEEAIDERDKNQNQQ